MEEIWADIVGFEKYQISSFGNVVNKGTGKLLKPYKTGKNRNYLTVRLYTNGRGTGKNCKVHRLVAESFVANPLNKPQVNHIDGDTLNNYVSNLEWVTNGENQKHAWDTGLQRLSNKQIATYTKNFGLDGSRPIKTQCKRGHTYTKENTYFGKKPGDKRCRICRQMKRKGLI